MKTPKVVVEQDGSITVSINWQPKGTMLEKETQIRDVVNEVGRCATGMALKSFDTNGEPILVEGIKHTSKQPQKKNS